MTLFEIELIEQELINMQSLITLVDDLTLWDFIFHRSYVKELHRELDDTWYKLRNEIRLLEDSSKQWRSYAEASRTCDFKVICTEEEVIVE